jgi:hypothetical protein
MCCIFRSQTSESLTFFISQHIIDSKDTYYSFSIVKTNTIIAPNNITRRLDIWTADTKPWIKPKIFMLCSLALPEHPMGAFSRCVSSLKRCMKTCCPPYDDVVVVAEVLQPESLGWSHCVITSKFLYGVVAQYRLHKLRIGHIVPWAEWGPMNTILLNSPTASASNVDCNAYAILERAPKPTLALYHFSQKQPGSQRNISVSMPSTDGMELSVDSTHVIIVPGKVIVVNVRIL